jgi:hypothetical protein
VQCVASCLPLFKSVKGPSHNQFASDIWCHRCFFEAN